MKKWLSILLILFSQFAKSQTANICVSVDCKSTVNYPVDTATLNGILTSVSPDAVKSALWSMKVGTAKIDSPNKAVTVGRGFAAGGATLYVFQLTGTSVNGATGTGQDSIVYVPNKPPTAVCGPTINDTLTSATLSGSGSFDPEGLPITYSWVQFSGPNTAVFSSVSMANPIVSGLITGTYNFTLTVTDQGGLKGTATQLVNVALPVVTLIKTVTVTTVTVTKYYSNNTSTSTTTTTTVTTTP